MRSILELFSDASLVEKIRRKLPMLFHMAELESSRAGKVGMEVGSLREKILIALLMYKFGEQVEISKEALTALVENIKTKTIRINWFREKVEFNLYKRWVDLWSED